MSLDNRLVCGTGDWSGPKPGDPNTNVNIQATPAFGGIDITWSFPTINPAAVAHMQLYRSAGPDPSTAYVLATVNGSFYYDKTTSATPIKWYYWVQVVSVNGTYGELVGPATATARPLIEDVMRGLTAKIDAGMLAQSLKKEIADIELNTLGINREILERAATDDALGAAFNEVQAHSEETRALLQSEVLARTTAESAFVDTVNTLYANVGEVTAAVQTTQSAHADLLSSLASSIQTTNAVLNGDKAAGQIGLVSKIDTVDGRVTEIGSMYTARLTVNGLIGGYGVYNDGRTVQAGFDVDTFWVGRTANDKIKPFIVEGEEVYIKEAVIKSLTFSKMRSETGALSFVNDKLQAKYIAVDQLNITNANIKGDLKSDNYIQGQRGWILKK